MQPFAIWDSARDVWEIPQTEGFFCEHLDVFLGTFPTLGMTVSGAAYELPTWEPATDGLEYSSLLLTPVVSEGEKATFQQGSAQRALTGQPFLTNQIRDVYDLNAKLLKTPTSQLAVNDGSQHPDKRREGGHGPTLADEVEHLLPSATDTSATAPHGGPKTPLLPTPVAQPSGNTPENHLRKKPGRQVVTDLAILVENDMLESGGKLLPTPAAMDGSGGRISKERGGFRESGAKRSITLSTAVHHDLAMLPTPKASDGEKGGPNQRGSSGDLTLPSASVRIGESTPQPSDAGNESSDGQLRGQLNLLDAITDTD